MNDEPDIFADPLALMEAAGRRSAEKHRRYNRVTRELFSTAKGREWLRLAIADTNFMGSVFDAAEEMNALKAAHRDGTRAILSQILNAIAADRQTSIETENDE